MPSSELPGPDRSARADPDSRRGGPGRPEVSVVIPTRERPLLVAEAVRSALAQTFEELEVVAVVDGPDERTRSALGGIRDPRLRVVALPRRYGVGGARNAGVRAARGAWIAFLDDDDTWMPGKLAAQLRTAGSCGAAHPVVACRVRARGAEAGDAVWPRRPPAPDEPLSEYLFARRGVFWGESLLIPSMLLVERRLALAVPFRDDLEKHEDLDWLLRVDRIPGTRVEFVPDAEPLVTWDVSRSRHRASRRPDWHGSLEWIRSCRGLVTGRAYAAFLLSWVASDAAREGSVAALGRLPYEAMRRGTPHPRDLALFPILYLLPEGARRRLGALLADR